jgi:hypothetical protein
MHCTCFYYITMLFTSHCYQEAIFMLIYLTRTIFVHRLLCRGLCSGSIPHLKLHDGAINSAKQLYSDCIDENMCEERGLEQSERVADNRCVTVHAYHTMHVHTHHMYASMCAYQSHHLTVELRYKLTPFQEF